MTKNIDRLTKREQVHLAADAMNGTSGAWGILYQSYRTSIVGYFKCRVGDHDLAEDLCEATFEYAKKGLMKGKYDMRYSFTTYLRNLAGFIYQRHLHEGTRFKDPEILRIQFPRSALAISSISNPERLNLRLRMLELLMKCGAKPHQILSVGFIKLLEWKPGEFVSEQSDRALGALAEQFFQDYFHTFGGLMNEELLFWYFQPLFEGLKKTTREIYTESEYRKRLGDFWLELVWNIPFKIFFTKDPESSMYNWCDKVKKQIRRLLELDDQNGRKA